MRRSIASVAVFTVCVLVTSFDAPLGAQQPAPPWLAPYREPAARLIGEELGSTFAWNRLALLTDTIGNRLSGTPQLDAGDRLGRRPDARATASRTCTPKRRWCRGGFAARNRPPSSSRRRIGWRCSGLAAASRTPPGGVEAPVLSVRSFEDLEAHAADGPRPDRPVQRAVCELWRNGPLPCRGRVARRRLRRGRGARPSVGPRVCGPRTPARCSTPANAPKIPAAAIAVEDADRIQRMIERGSRVVVRLQMEAHFEPDVESANVVGEIRGREKPDEIVVVERPPRLVGRRRRRDRRWRRVRRHVGGAAADEEAEPAAAPDRARRVVDERGERRPRRPGVPRRARGRAAQPRADARVGRRRVPAARDSGSRGSDAARGDREARSRRCSRHRGRPD